MERSASALASKSWPNMFVLHFPALSFSLDHGTLLSFRLFRHLCSLICKRTWDFFVLLRPCVYSFLAAFLFRKVANLLELFIEAKRKRFVEPLSRFSAALASRVCISNPIAHRIRTALFFPISCIFSLFLLAQPQIDPLSLKQEIRASLCDAFLIKLALMSEQLWLSQDFPYYQNRYRLSGYHAILNEILWVFLGTKWAVDEINSR